MPDEPPPLDSEDERNRHNAALIEHGLTRHRRRHGSVLALMWGVVLVGALAVIWKLASTWVPPP